MRTFLQAHLTDAFHQGGIEALDRQINPSVVVFGAGIKDLGADAEASEVTLIGYLHCGVIVGPLGHNDITCEKL